MADDAPRPSTLRHMRKLMAAATAVGVASVTTRGSATDPKPTENATTSDEPSQAPSGSDAGAAGYMVVDPIPPPASRGCACGKPGMNQS
jgi:hypothetical protein